MIMENNMNCLRKKEQILERIIEIRDMILKLGKTTIVFSKPLELNITKRISDCETVIRILKLNKIVLKRDDSYFSLQNEDGGIVIGSNELTFENIHSLREAIVEENFNEYFIIHILKQYNMLNKWRANVDKDISKILRDGSVVRAFLNEKEEFFLEEYPTIEEMRNDETFKSKMKKKIDKFNNKDYAKDCIEWLEKGGFCPILPEMFTEVWKKKTTLFQTL